MKLDKLEKFYDIVLKLLSKRWSGTIEAKIVIRDGGIRSIEKNLKDFIE